jgi:DNA recombination protein RmuC
MGFRTLAIQQRSVEVWNTLGAVKTEFGKFGIALQAVKKKLEEAHSKIEQTETRHRAMDRKLRGVEGLPEAEAAKLLGDVAAAEEGEEESG